MPERNEKNGSVSFDFSRELLDFQINMEDILETYNPHNPATYAMIMGEVERLVKKVDSAWSQEYTNALSKAVNQGTGNMLAAVFAMSEIAKEKRGEE